MLRVRVLRPVALDLAQPFGGIADRRDLDLDRIEPDIGDPGDRFRGTGRDQEPIIASADLAELGGELVGEAFGREIAGDQQTLR